MQIQRASHNVLITIEEWNVKYIFCSVSINLPINIVHFSSVYHQAPQNKPL
jgi:hypothetical protein